MTKETNPPNIVGMILAGGQSSRMQGKDKAILPLNHTPLLLRVANRLKPQLLNLAINRPLAKRAHDANLLPAWLMALAWLEDDARFGEYQGPLAGILAGLAWAKYGNADFLVVAACDCPLIPLDFVQRLASRLTPDPVTQDTQEGSKAVVFAASGGRLHPVNSLWSVSLLSDLENWLATNQSRKIEYFVRTHCGGIESQEWPIQPYDPFLNINSPEDITSVTPWLD